MVIKTFSVTMAKQREELAGRIMEYVRANAHLAFAMDAQLTSDASFHCLTITLFGKPNRACGGTIEGYKNLRIISATKAKEREALGDSIGEISDHAKVITLQSSDEEFHCLVYLILE